MGDAARRRRALAQDRDVVILAARDAGLPNAVIARVLGISGGTVRKAINPTGKSTARFDLDHWRRFRANNPELYDG